VTFKIPKKVFLLFNFLRHIYIILQIYKAIKKSENSTVEIKVFLSIFLLDNGRILIPNYDESGSGRSENIGIRIHNADSKTTIIMKKMKIAFLMPNMSVCASPPQFTAYTASPRPRTETAVLFFATFKTRIRA
jgi:hypothetical protein